MKESITVAEIKYDELDSWKANSARSPLMAKVAQIVLVTPASEAICKRLFKRAGTTDRRVGYITLSVFLSLPH